MNNPVNVPYDVLYNRYLQAQYDIVYLEHRISELHEEVDLWQKAYEEYSDILSEHGLI